MGKPGFVEARPKGGGEIQLVPEHYVENPAFGFVPIPSVRDTGLKATRHRPAKPADDAQEEQEGTK